MDMLRSLKAGRSESFGDAVLHDGGMTLIKHKIFGANEPVVCGWNDLRVWSADGCFYIASKSDKQVYAALSYINVANAHILEQAITMGFKKGIVRLSELLD
jgi:hypothetical protein